MNRVRLLVVVVLGCCFFYFISMFNDVRKAFSSKRIIEEPIDFIELVKKEAKDLKHIYTLSVDSKFPVSVYTYDNSKYGLILFKKKINKERRIEDIIKFHNESPKKAKNKVYTKFISMENLSYSYEELNEVNRVNLFLKDFKEEYVKFKGDNELYITFMLNNSFGISYDDSNDISLHSELKKDSDLEFNELMVLKKEDIIYFLYLKPINENKHDRKVLGDLIELH